MEDVRPKHSVLKLDFGGFVLMVEESGMSWKGMTLGYSMIALYAECRIPPPESPDPEVCALVLELGIACKFWKVRERTSCIWWCVVQGICVCRVFGGLLLRRPRAQGMCLCWKVGSGWPGVICRTNKATCMHQRLLHLEGGVSSVFSPVHGGWPLA